MCSVRAAVKHALIPDSMQCLRLWVHFAADAPFLIIIVVPSWVQRGKIPLSCIALWIGILDDMRLHVINIIMIITRWWQLLKTRTSFTTRACAAQQTIESSMDNRWEGKFINSIFHYTAQLWRIKLVKLSVTPLDQYYNEQGQFTPIINIEQYFEYFRSMRTNFLGCAPFYSATTRWVSIITRNSSLQNSSSKPSDHF